MTEHNYRAMLMRLEREARDNPGWYRFKVTCLVGLAYAYIGIIILLALGLLGGTIYGVYWLVVNLHRVYGLFRIVIPVVIGLLTFLGAVLRALWVSIPEPKGRVLHRGEAIPLFQEIDRLCAVLKTPRFDTVIVDAEFNAAVCQVPRLGIFGWQKNFLRIGLPLMLTLSPDEFRAVLAHEMGHIARDDHQFQHKVYRLYDTWSILLYEFGEEHTAANILFVPFLEWYVPFFYAYTFALRRADEYAADKAAARAVGAEKIADALIRLELFPYRMKASRDGAMTDARAQQAWLNDALSVPDSPDDEHPSLQNRLRAIGQVNRTIQPPAEQSAAARYLGNRMQEIAGSVGITFASAPSQTEAPSTTPATASRRSTPTMATIGGDTDEPMLQPVGGGR